MAARFFNAVGMKKVLITQKARDVVPGFDKLVKQLTPKVEEDRLMVMKLDEKELTETLKPVVGKIRDRAEDARSMNQC